MSISDIILHCESEIATHGHVRFSAAQFAALTDDEVVAIQEKYKSKFLMRLPEHEVAFFEWLKTSDNDVWRDLWEADDEPYLVSLAFLPDFSGKNKNGQFVICDLVDNDNYYFSPDLLLERESSDFIEGIQKRFHEGGKLTLQQSLALEASFKAFDIWHFAKKYGVEIAVAKKAAHELVDDRILVHVPKADHLSDHFEIT
ncbi:MAG: hypothetical protein HQ472_09910 [Ignavibacteria bacterium]|nr:hypothetical protein [Ignavibacteria bacterium]